MGADASLVEGAYRAAMANVPKDYSQMYASLAESQVGAVRGVVTAGIHAFANVKAVREKKKKELAVETKKFSNSADIVLNKIASYKKNEALNEKIYNQYFDKIQTLKEEFELNNAIGDDDTPEMQKARHKLYAELEKYKNQAVQIRGDFLKLGELDKAKQINYEASGAENLAVMAEVLNQDGDYTNVDMEWDDKGGMFAVDMTHVVDENEFLEDGVTKNPNFMQPLYGEPDDDGRYIIRMRFDDVMNKIIVKDPATETAINKIIIDSYGSGKEVGGAEFDFSLTADKIRDAIKDENVFVDLANRRLQGHKLSWADSLEAHPAISVMTYENLGVDASAADTNRDGVISATEAQQLNAENQAMVIDALTDRTHANFDLETSKTELANYYALMADDQFKNGRVARDGVIIPLEDFESDDDEEDDEGKEEVIVKTKGKDVVVKTGNYTTADYEGMNTEQIHGLDITRTRAMFKGGNRRIDPEGEGGGVRIFGNQVIRAAGILKALRNLESEYTDFNLNINSLADLKRITQLIRKDADFRKKITEAMNALDKKGQRKIKEKYVHKYFVDLQERWNAEYSERGQETQETQTQTTADKFNK